MFQNHMLQLLSLCAMEPPSRFLAIWSAMKKARCSDPCAP
jgi:glucose-6-phosphate 1-dehydrogenase